MAEDEESNLKNGSLDFKKRRGIYVPVYSTTVPPVRVLSSFWRWVGVGDKTLWNWLELLIVPLFLAGGAFYLESQTEVRQEQIATNRYQQEEQIATNRYQQEALAKYLDQMTALLLDEDLRKSAPDSEARSIARARTITALQELDGDRKGLLISFLHESNLISNQTFVSSNQTFVSLDNADLIGADLTGTYLSGADLSGAYLHNADLSGADLHYADLMNADLSGANLSGANLHYADLTGVNLSGADLIGADLSNADLSNADLSNADLSGAYLNNADLRVVDLSGADLIGADLSNADLSGADLGRVSLCKTTMPNEKVENRDC